jgi:alanine racemase
VLCCDNCPMPRPIQAIIHAYALRHNLLKVRHTAPSARVWAVVKANAYGHGLGHVFAALQGADGFALLDLTEAQTLRSLGWRGPILLLEGVFDPRDLELCSRLDLWHVVHCDEQIDMLRLHKTERGQRVFLKLNSGMNRLGFAPERYRSAWTRLSLLPQVEEISHLTHFANADVAPDASVQRAVQTFQTATQDLSGETSLSNSAAIFCQPQVFSDWVRPGIALYGGSPDAASHSAAHWGLRAAMSLRSRVMAVQQVQAGAGVGYGGTFVAKQAMRVGVVAAGYADGYPRHAPTGTPVLVDGLRSRTLGRVSMDMICVDLSHLPAAGVGSGVTLWGDAEGASTVASTSLPIDEVAHSAGTLAYELMCALAARVPVRLDDAASV